MTLLRPFLPLALAACVTACSSSTPLSPASAPALPGQWTLQPAHAPGDAGVIRLVLRESPPREGGQQVLEVSGFAGINHYKGTATVSADGHMLVMGTLATTRMAGPADRMAAEGAYLQKLEQVGSYDWQDGSLVLKTLAGETLTFVRSTAGGH